ncbi:hypothetical protein B0H66DRAFT_578375 [Apodospora peruviana]|uniref:Uncharacterized protein n=1 Tax=Apodospora peruviana TaxID=516989 RepID=A0AAE0HSI4_9PEZI|nr:hypothetical protein B0H66DRAFT_578375 [Apodospora peruviana]
MQIQTISGAGTSALAEKALEEEGFFEFEDSTLGEHVVDLEQKGFASESGLDFCQQILYDERIRPLIKATLKTCVLVHRLRYKAHSGHVMRISAHIWAKGSEADYFPGSHLVDVPTPEGKRLLWETEESGLLEAGCHPVQKSFKDGGL